MQNKELNREIKEDFSGFTEVTVHDVNNQETTNYDEPIKMDVSDARSNISQNETFEENSPMLPGVVDPSNTKGLFSQSTNQPNPHSNSTQQLPHPQHSQSNQLPNQLPNQTPNQPSNQIPNQPSFWQSLLSRGVTILIVTGIIVLLWWLWSSYSKSATTTINQMNELVQENVVEPVKRVFKLPPQL